MEFSSAIVGVLVGRGGFFPDQFYSKKKRMLAETRRQTKMVIKQIASPFFLVAREKSRKAFIPMLAER